MYGYQPQYGTPVQVHDPHISPQYMQPTKVIHLRNLPFDITLEELREFCAPWGTVVALKDKVGANRNQAFVEFAGLEQAMAIVNHYQHAAEPAKFRGRPTWLSFSGREKLTNVAPSTDSPTPVLHVSVNNIAPDLAQAVNLELLNTVFSGYGYVKKLITYSRPEGGMYCWVQFPDTATAASARASLQGQPIPRHLVSDHPSPPVLDIAFAATTDLAIRTQSQLTRDFTNAALPWGEPDMGMIQGLLPAAGGTDGPSNVLSVSFDRMTYPVTLDGIHTIFSTYGFVQKIHIFEREGRTVALVQYADIPTADSARAALEGHAMYDGGHNVMHVVYSKHRNLSIRPGSERSKDYTMGAVPNPPQPAATPPPARPGPQPPRQGMGGPPPGMGGGYGGVPPHAGPYGAPPAAGGYGAPPPAARYDPNIAVTGEEYVRQHERVLEQYGGRTSGKGAPAPYAAPPAYGGGYAAPVAPAYPAPPAAPAYGAPPPQTYAAPPVAGGYGAAPGYGAPPAAPPTYSGQPPVGYAAPPPAAGYGGGYGAPPPTAAGGYGGYAPPPGGAPPAYGAPPAGGYGYGY